MSLRRGIRLKRLKPSRLKWFEALQKQVEELQEQVGATKEKFLSEGRLKGYMEGKIVGTNSAIQEYLATE